MHIITEKINIVEINRTSNISRDDIFIDIETLGLSSKRDKIYLIGMAVISDNVNTADLTLFFADNSNEEADILREFKNKLPEEGRIITYNGNTFDIPFLEERANKYGIGLELSGHKSLDLLKEARSLKSLLLLPGCKQKDIENYLGIAREDKYSGGDLIKVYKDYELRPDEDAREKLLQHNRDDVAGLINIMPILAYKKLRNASFEITDADFSSDKELVVTGNVDVSLPCPLRISGRQHYILIEGNTLRAVFLLKDGKLRYEYTDYRNYVYLPDEDIAVPKALAASIPKERKAKATPDNCHGYVPATPETLTGSALTKYIDSLLHAIK